MANINLFYKKLLAHEGGFVNNQFDKGGATNKGVTFGTWKKRGYDKDGDGDIDIEDLKQIDDNDFKMILKIGYWDQCKADLIKNQSVAEIIVDWNYLSGLIAVKEVQRILGQKDDGVVGPVTMNALNAMDQEQLFNSIKEHRVAHIMRIVATNKSQLIFKKGWMNRINSFKFVA